ncbi:tryptophan 7-halogenase [Aurantiacibacter spongiae]|uniref:Tryptophan halogenase n=1 Tax=Aurantiacibacter spongiae TaxID=2488860 RepID=A0A3N5CQP8_9SPHN|nr:tryptophan 7-halogenase [Aurantiacibacter spongiae]RPF70937.1 hypothetical protein EG799_04375 [Aurantiacibacter spongiae]
MSAAREPLRRVVVAGGGQVGVLCAIAIRRALPACEVVVIGLAPEQSAFADRSATALPFTNRLHDRLGIGEDRIIREAGGSHRLVERLIGWGGEGQYETLSYGGASNPAQTTRFAREWGGGKQTGTVSRSPGSLAEVLAEAGRFCVPPGDVSTPLDEVDYALRWNPGAYRNILIAEARSIGVAHVHGDIAAIQPGDDGGIAVLSIAGQGELAADLFVDCSGPGAALLSVLAGYETQDWTAYLPVRRMMIAPPGQPMLALEDRTTLLAEGWLSEFAGRDGLQVALAMPDGLTREAAIRTLQSEPAEEIAISPGCASRPWLGNVVAIGDAAARFEPLGRCNLDLAHRQLDLLLELLPGRDVEPRERAEYNRRAGLMADAMRDTLGMAYAAPGARRVFGDTKRSDALATTLDQFTRRGRLPTREEAPFLSREYVGLLTALGFARGIPPQSRTADPREGEQAQSMFAAKARAALEYAPPYAQWLQAALSPAPRG